MGYRGSVAFGDSGRSRIRRSPSYGEVTLAVRVNGKVRFRVSVGVARDEALDLVAGADNARRYLGGSEFRRVVDRFPNLLNLVV